MMLEFLPALGSLLAYGSVSPSSKRAINELGRHKSIVYAYAAMVLLFIAGALVLGITFAFPGHLVLPYLLQIAAGGLGAIAAFKALDYGKASITSPISKSYVILVLAMGILFLGEELSAGQIAGSLLMVAAAIVLSLDSRGELRPKRWMVYLGLSMLCRAYYYTFIKTFVNELGPYLATLSLELGIVAFVVAFHALRGRDLSAPQIGKLRFAALSGSLIFLGSLAYSLSVASIGAALTAAISAGTPIVNAGVSYALLKEKLDIYKYAAILMVVLGLAMIVLF